MSDSLSPPGLQHPRLPCPSPTPGACSNSCPSSWWCHPRIRQLSYLLSSPSPPAFNLSQNQGLFQWVGSNEPSTHIKQQFLPTGVGDGQGSLACCSPVQQLNWTELNLPTDTETQNSCGNDQRNIKVYLCIYSFASMKAFPHIYLLTLLAEGQEATTPW